MTLNNKRRKQRRNENKAFEMRVREISMALLADKIEQLALVSYGVSNALARVTITMDDVRRALRTIARKEAA